MQTLRRPRIRFQAPEKGVPVAVRHFQRVVNRSARHFQNNLIPDNPAVDGGVNRPQGSNLFLHRLPVQGAESGGGKAQGFRRPDGQRPEAPGVGAVVIIKCAVQVEQDRFYHVVVPLSVGRSISLSCRIFPFVSLRAVLFVSLPLFSLFLSKQHPSGKTPKGCRVCAFASVFHRDGAPAQAAFPHAKRFSRPAGPPPAWPFPSPCRS